MNLQFLNRLGSLGAGYYQGQDELLRRQILQNQLQQSQQQQAGLAALANAYGSLPTPPQPGQPSQPAQPPQQPPPQTQPAMGAPQLPNPGIGPQRGPVGMPQPQGQLPAAPPIKPYTSPTAGPAAAPMPGPQQQPQISAPPQPAATAAVQSTLPDLRTMAQTLERQGIKGTALLAALNQHAQFLSMEGKQELAQLNGQVRMMQAENAALRAGADVTRANTGAKAENLKERGAAGETAMSKATIDEKEARARHLSQLSTQAAYNKPGKPQVFTGEDGKRYSSQLMPDGQIITRDATGRLVNADGAPTPVTPGQQTMRNTVKLDISEIDYALDNMKKQGPGATASIFFESPDAGTIGRWRNKELTPDEQQQYDVYANRLSTAIAGIQSMGRGQISDEKVRQARKLVPVPGDADQTIQTKLAAIQRIRDQANQIMKGRQPDDIKSDPGKGSGGNVVDWESLK